MRVYLDYAATTPMSERAREAVREAEEKFFANASALHTPGHLAAVEIEECREVLASLIGAEPGEIIFTSGASEANNTVMHIFEGCEIETSDIEHHSVIEAAKIYRGRRKNKLRSYMLANNETGEILDVSTKTDDSRHATSRPSLRGSVALSAPVVADGLESSVFVHSDLTQVLGKMEVDVKKLGLDYATFSAHKIGGPLGVGALYVREGVPFRPLIVGGNQERKRRGGTYNTPGIAGFKAVLLEVKERKTWEIYDREVRKLRDRLAERILAEIPGSSLNTDIRRGQSLPNILNASFRAAEGESIQLYLDAAGVVVSTGSACAAGDIRPSHVLMAKTGDAEVAHSSIRFSFGLENTMEDVDYVMSVLPGIVERLQKISTIEIKEKK